MGYLLSRRALLAGSASGAALLAFPRATWSAEPAKGGRLVVAADSEPPNLNPAMVASNGVFFVASKVIEPLAESSYEGKDGLSPRLATATFTRTYKFYLTVYTLHLGAGERAAGQTDAERPSRLRSSSSFLPASCSRSSRSHAAPGSRLSRGSQPARSWRCT